MSELYVTWSEDLKLPLCDYCLRGQSCQCAAKDAEICDFCEDGCDCGFEQLENGEVCGCSCGCGEGEDGNCQECCDCDYPIKDDLPDMCYCECNCEQCTCRCECPRLVINADSYNDWVQETCYICPPEELTDNRLGADVFEQRALTPIGNFFFLIRTLPPTSIVKTAKFGLPTFFADPKDMMEYEQTNWIDVVQQGYRGKIRFDGPVHIPMLAKEHLYQNRLQVWMSLTPMEVFSQKDGLDFAWGNVLVGGLGMGWLTQRILQKPEVNRVSQVEIDSDILEFFGRPLEHQYGNKIELIRSDVYQYLDAVGADSFDTIILDIWPKYVDARRDPSLKKLRKLHPRVWAWGEIPIRNKS